MKAGYVLRLVILIAIALSFNAVLRLVDFSGNFWEVCTFVVLLELLTEKIK